MTLIELVVVISIIVILLAFTMPALRVAMEDKIVREASRGVTTYLGAARTRAIETGRPVGVAFIRLDGGNPADAAATIDGATVLQQVQIPPPYAGDDYVSSVNVRLDAPGSNLVHLQFVRSDTGAASSISVFNASSNQSGLVSDGDLIQIGGAGPYYTLTNIDPSGNTADAVVDFTATTAAQLPWSTSVLSAPLPYKIIRQPFVGAGAVDWLARQPGAIEPFRLPGGAVVDLGFTGCDGELDTANGDPHVSEQLSMVVFSPSGAVEAIYHQNLIPGDANFGEIERHGASEPIYLLIGRRDQLGSYDTSTQYVPPDDGRRYNWADQRNVWAVLSPQTGTISPAEVVVIPAAAPIFYDTSGAGNDSRQLARTAQSMGGRGR